MISKLPYY